MGVGMGGGEGAQHAADAPGPTERRLPGGHPPGEARGSAGGWSRHRAYDGTRTVPSSQAGGGVSS